MAIRLNAYSPEEDRWLRENTYRYSRKEAVEIFNRTFGRNRSVDSLKVHANKMGLRFKNDKRTCQTMPIGTERVRNGYIWVKVKDDVPRPGEAAGYINWRPKAQVVYEKAYGPIPEGYIVVFLNRDKTDCRPENLYAVSPRVNREMGKKRWWSEDQELTLTAIKWCELFYAIKDLGEQ